MLSTYASDHHFDWEQHIRKVYFAYNSSMQASKGYTYSTLCLAVKPDYLWMLYMECQTQRHSYAKVLHKQMIEAFALVRSKLATQCETQKDFYNHKVNGKLYAPGNFVWLHSPLLVRENHSSFTTHGPDHTK